MGHMTQPTVYSTEVQWLVNHVKGRSQQTQLAKR